MPKPKPSDEFYDFLSDEAIAYLIANQELDDLDNYLHFENVWAFRLLGETWFPMRFEGLSET